LNKLHAFRPGLRFVTALALVLSAFSTLAADPDLARAEEHVRSGQYQAAYDLLAPLAHAGKASARFNYLLGRAALGIDRADEAKTLLEQALRLKPDDIAARLALGRAYLALGQYAEAKIELETVLRFDNLPPDVMSQVEIYARAAQNQEEGKRLTAFGYAETGIGRYRVNSTSGTNALGGGDRRDTFYNARVGGGLNYALSGQDAFDASLDYRFRYYDSDHRDDKDLRWRAALSRALGEDNIAVGLRGRASYRGADAWRNDASIFTSYRYRLDPDNQLTAAAEVRRRRYPSGPLRERSRTTADVSAGWLHAFAEGKASFALRGWVGRNYATSRADGESNIYGAEAQLDATFSKQLSGFLMGWYERDVFNTDRVHFHPDSIDGEILRRKDDLYEIAAGLVWTFARGWSLRPEILYIHDKSNAVAFNYSSTEAWINIRYSF
jgi:tetratricopeptide (TPR) repeat protein